LKPNRELNARFGEARSEYVVDSEPIIGVRVSVRVYGNVEIGVGMLVGEARERGEGVSVAAGRVLNRRPVDMPIKDDIGE
jgi:hypothetical protein